MSYRDLSDAALTELSASVRDEIARRQSLRDFEALVSEYSKHHSGAELHAFLAEFCPAPVSEPEVPEPAREFSFVRHSPNNRSTFWDSITSSVWANGAFMYWPGPWGHSELKWDSYWAAVVSAYPQGLHTVVSPKHVDEAALKTFCQNLPKAWRDKMVYAFYQEPEDNFTTEAQIATFRENVRRAGAIVRPYGIRNAVELQEWSLNPANNSYPSGMDNTARFVDPADVDHISWSLYEKNLKDRSLDMVGRVQTFMNRFPKLTWDMSATGVAVPVGTALDDPRRTARANITKSFLTLAAADPRCTGFGWFDFPAWNGSLDYAVDQQLLNVFKAYSPRF